MKRQSLSPTRRLALFERASGRCHICEQRIRVGERWEVEHRIPLAMGGADDETNMSPAHVACHSAKSKADAGKLAKVHRVRAKHLGIRSASNPMEGSRKSRWKRLMRGETVLR